ncbi:flagellar protein FlaG [Hippea jasoniae]|uniref:flagellar protein FlaG n=1 Tax=Hippea jasoniae TaxID=944479 RepID=UPI0006893E86|nr:flagellar protein FlaG [Hippea jasoniae]
MSSGINKIANEVAVKSITQNQQTNKQINSPKDISKISINESYTKNSTQSKQLKPHEIKKIIEKLNENVGKLTQDVKFTYSDTIKSLVVKVIDAKTGQVIREIPPKEVINLQKKLSEVVGIIFDSKEVER